MPMTPTRGKVPHFTMRPHPVVAGALILTLVVGLLLALSFLSQEDGSGASRQRAVFVLVMTVTFTILLTIVATAKLWYPHLWKKNSTHERHRQHSRHHPINQRHTRRR